MFMRPDGGWPMSPVPGSWHISVDNFDPHGSTVTAFYNTATPVTFNAPAGAAIHIIQKEGDTEISHSLEYMPNLNSYPSHWSDGMGGISPSGIPTALQGLEFYETKFIVREHEWYKGKGALTLIIRVEHQGAVFEKSYQQELKWDHYRSSKGNAFISDLRQGGVPFIPQYRDWKCVQPMTGEYIFVDSKGRKIIYDGYFAICFWEDHEAMTGFYAFRAPYQDHYDLVEPTSIGAMLDIMTAGFDGDASSAQLSTQYRFHQTKQHYNNGQGFYHYQCEHGTYLIFDGLYFTDAKLSAQQIEDMQIKSGNNLLFMHDFDELLGHHRFELGGHSFWKVLSSQHPAPAWGGVYGHEMPEGFVNGIFNYVVDHPLWFKRIRKQFFSVSP